MKNKEYCDYNILIMALETLREQVVDNHKQYNYAEDLSRLKRIATELERVRCSESQNKSESQDESESYDQNTM